MNKKNKNQDDPLPVKQLTQEQKMFLHEMHQMDPAQMTKQIVVMLEKIDRKEIKLPEQGNDSITKLIK